MTALFERSSINGLSLNNRFVRSATWEGLATDGESVTPSLIEKMVELAKRSYSFAQITTMPQKAGVKRVDRLPFSGPNNSAILAGTV